MPAPLFLVCSLGNVSCFFLFARISETRHRLCQSLSATISQRTMLKQVLDSLALFVKGHVSAKELGTSLSQTIKTPNTLKIIRTLVDCFPSTDSRSVDALKAYQELRAATQAFPLLPSSSLQTSRAYQYRPFSTLDEPSLTTVPLAPSGGHRPSFTQMVKNPNSASSSSSSSSLSSASAAYRLPLYSYASMGGQSSGRVSMDDTEQFPSLVTVLPKAAKQIEPSVAERKEEEQSESMLSTSKKKTGAKKKTILLKFG